MVADAVAVRYIAVGIICDKVLFEQELLWMQIFQNIINNIVGTLE